MVYSPDLLAVRIEELVKIKGTNVAAILKQCGVNKNMVFTLKSRGSMPQVDNIAKLADALECSIDYLMGRTDYPEINNSPSSLPDSEERLLHDIRRLDDEGRMMVSAAVIRETRRMQKGESWLLDEPDDSDAE